MSLAFLQRDDNSADRVSSSSFRLLHFALCVTAFLVFTAYTAVMTSWMTAAEPPVDIAVRTTYMNKRRSLL